MDKEIEERIGRLSPERYRVLREKATEPPFSGRLLHNAEEGIYSCAACAAELFTSEAKYDSGSGWPSFWAPVREDAVHTVRDESLGIERTEIVCARCGSHLGHVFPDGPRPSGQRYCVNSLSLEFTKGMADEDESVTEGGMVP